MTHRGPFQPLLFCDSVILCPGALCPGAELDVSGGAGQTARVPPREAAAPRRAWGPAAHARCHQKLAPFAELTRAFLFGRSRAGIRAAQRGALPARSTPGASLRGGDAGLCDGRFALGMASKNYLISCISTTSPCSSSPLASVTSSKRLSVRPTSSTPTSTWCPTTWTLTMRWAAASRTCGELAEERWGLQCVSQRRCQVESCPWTFRSAWRWSWPLAGSLTPRWVTAGLHRLVLAPRPVYRALGLRPAASVAASERGVAEVPLPPGSWASSERGRGWVRWAGRVRDRLRVCPRPPGLLALQTGLGVAEASPCPALRAPACCSVRMGSTPEVSPDPEARCPLKQLGRLLWMCWSLKSPHAW